MSDDDLAPSLYDLLDVDPTATPAEIRAAWQAAIADLGPADRRFRAYNRAAETLLDPQQREAYDAGRAPVVVEPVTEPVEEPAEEPVGEEPGDEPEDQDDSLDEDDSDEDDSDEDDSDEDDSDEDDSEAAPRRLGGSRGLIVLAAVTALVVVLTAVAWVGWARTQGSDGPVSTQGISAAEDAARSAAAPVLSYDYRSLDADAERAQTYLTRDYAGEYDDLIEALRTDVEDRRTVVEASVVDAGVSGVGEDRVDVLVFVDQVSTRRDSPEPFTLRMWVTMTMTQEDGQWMVDAMSTGSVLPDSATVPEESESPSSEE